MRKVHSGTHESALGQMPMLVELQVLQHAAMPIIADTQKAVRCKRSRDGRDASHPYGRSRCGVGRVGRLIGLVA